MIDIYGRSLKFSDDFRTEFLRFAVFKCNVFMSLNTKNIIKTI